MCLSATLLVLCSPFFVVGEGASLSSQSYKNQVFTHKNVLEVRLLDLQVHFPENITYKAPKIMVKKLPVLTAHLLIENKSSGPLNELRLANAENEAYVIDQEYGQHAFMSSQNLSDTFRNLGANIPLVDYLHFELATDHLSKVTLVFSLSFDDENFTVIFRDVPFAYTARK